MPVTINGDTGITGVPAIGSAVANTAVVMNDSGSNSNTVRAWVNFNGTGTVAIRASFNVTSITDNGTGFYIINFTNALPNANYAVAGSGSNGGRILSVGTLTTTTASVLTYNAGDVAEDNATVSVSIFR